jgi:hypothetical protein
MIETLCILSQLLNGNRDCIENIYNKTKNLEKNEIIQYYLLNGLKNHMIYTYNVYSLTEDRKEYVLSTDDEFPYKYYDVITGDERVYQMDLYEKIPDSFLSTFFLHQCQKHWAWIRKGLEYDIRYCNHIMINCLEIERFILIAKESSFGFPEHEIIREFKKPNIKQKTHALNFVKTKHGILYLDMIKNEFLNYDLYVAIILREDGTVESIMGGRGEVPTYLY